MRSLFASINLVLSSLQSCRLRMNPSRETAHPLHRPSHLARYPTAPRGSARPSPAPSCSSWSANFRPTCTCPDSGELRLPPTWNFRKNRSRFGSKTEGSSIRRRTCLVDKVRSVAVWGLVERRRSVWKRRRMRIKKRRIIGTVFVSLRITKYSRRWGICRLGAKGRDLSTMPIFRPASERNWTKTSFRTPTLPLALEVLIVRNILLNVSSILRVKIGFLKKFFLLVWKQSCCWLKNERKSRLINEKVWNVLVVKNSEFFCVRFCFFCQQCGCFEQNRLYSGWQFNWILYVIVNIVI